MRGQMKNKRGDLTAKEIIKIVFAIIGISLLIYLLAGLYGIFERDNEFKQAKSGLAEIKNAIEYVQKEVRETNFILQSKKGWNLIYFENLGKNLCLCFDSNTNPEECINGNSGICEKLEQPFSLQNSKVDSNSNYFELVPPVTEFKLSKKEDKFILEVFEKSLKEEEETSSILEFKGDGKFEVLSEEECKSGLEQRKKDLGIPDKLCYWETMTEVYKDKCENLDEAQIKEIFEKKAEYRKLNNPDWPNLNTDRDFCVPVIYDCDAWFNKHNGKHEAVYGSVEIEDKTRTIHLNPFINITKSKADFLILHEGLHTIQTFSEKNILDYKGIIFDPHSLVRIDPELKEVWDKSGILRENVLSIAYGWRKEESDKLKLLSGKEGYMDAFNKLQEEQILLNKYLTSLKTTAIPIDIFSFVPEGNSYYYKAKTDEKFKEATLGLNNFLKGDFDKFRKLLKAYSYTAEIDELDPRLSEIHRWWFDKTAPNCEIIENSEKAKEVLDKFLKEDVGVEYAITQEELKDVIIVAKYKGIEQEIYNKLTIRLPGLAMNEEEGEIIYYG
jgi:hypothetical protein